MSDGEGFREAEDREAQSLTETGTGGLEGGPVLEPKEPTVWQRITGVAGGDWQSMFLIPLLAVFTALLIGALIIALSNTDLLRLWGEDPVAAFRETISTIVDAYIGLFRGAFGSIRGISETLPWAAPLILAGLSVAVGFRAGLFNIGAEGQMLIGGISATVIGFALELPTGLHMILALFGAMAGGAIWGGAAGLLRAKTGAHEVITTIMLNWIAIRLIDYLLATSFIQKEGRRDPISEDILQTAWLPKLLSWLDPQLRVHGGIIVALLAAWLVWWLLFRSTIGFEWRAVGYNPDGARYAGINVGRSYTTVMSFAGGLSGLAGGVIVLGVLHRATPGFAFGLGFDAIALALLGRSHPFGVVLAGLRFGALRAGGQQMQASSTVNIDLILVLQALIVVFIAAPELIRSIYRIKAPEEEKGAEAVTSGWGT